MECFKAVKSEGSLWMGKCCWKPLLTQKLCPIQRVIAAVTVVDGDEVRARGIKDDEILGTSLRAWAWCTRMSKLILMAQVLESVLIEKFTVPSLANTVR